MYNIRAPRGIQPLNAVYDVRSTVRDLTHQTSSGVASGGQQKSMSILYDAPTLQQDRSILMGEVLFTPARAWIPGANDDPEVRSCLNGVLFKTNGKTLEDKKKDLRKSIRPVSIALKHVIFDTPNIARGPSDQPVGAVAGQMTVTNLGDKPIEMGQAMQIAMPTTEFMNQYNDGITKVSDNRRAIAYKKLEMPHTLKGVYDSPDEKFKEAVEAACLVIAKGNKSEAKKLKEGFENALKDPDVELKLIRDSVVAASRAAITYKIKRCIGGVLKGGEPGQKFVCNSQPMTNLVARAVDPDIRVHVSGRAS